MADTHNNKRKSTRASKPSTRSPGTPGSGNGEQRYTDVNTVYMQVNIVSVQLDFKSVLVVIDSGPFAIVAHDTCRQLSI